jgi:glycine/D-amino acid oxidase-like deaminating enzyme
VTDEPDATPPTPRPSRRAFIVAGAIAATAGAATLAARVFGAPALLGLTPKGRSRISGGWVNESAAMGHRLRDRSPIAPAVRTRKVPVVIVGGGIAGLSAAWQLERRGFHDFVLLEMERETGGNSRAGENAVSRYPWAAHYVPVPGPRATLVRELFTELGVLTDAGWDERSLCFAPHERMFVQGLWQTGLESELLGSRVGRDELRRFETLLAEHRASGQFTIPMALGAPRESPLDRMSFDQWLTAHDLRSPAVRWYAEYATRDDYGALARDTSAWAGLHYFASREQTEDGPLTWPEGNAWIARRLTNKLANYVVTGAPVQRVRADGRRWRVRTGDEEISCEQVIFAAPTFLAPYLIEGARSPEFVYSPWLVANLTLDHWPDERGVPPAWDNVIRAGAGLGYVVATHQSLRARPGESSVWTYYHALADRAPAVERNQLLAARYDDWMERIMMELEVAHPNIRRCVTHVDIFRIGHAMVRPTIGFLSQPARTSERWSPPGIHLAHSDVSGLSLFEEAQYRGVAAADAVLSTLGGG